MASQALFSAHTAVLWAYLIQGAGPGRQYLVVVLVVGRRHLT